MTNGDEQYPRNPGGILRDAWQFARALAAYRPRAATLALLLLITASATEAFGILMLIPILHTVGTDANPAQQGAVSNMLNRLANALGLELTLPTALAAFVTLTIARSLIVGQRDILLPKIRLGFVDDLQGKLHQAVANAKWQFLAGQRQSDFQHILTGEVPRIRIAGISFLHAATAAVLLAMQLAIAFLISPAVSAAALAAAAALLLLTRPLVRRSQTLGAQVVGGNRTVFSRVMDFISGLKLAKSQAQEQAYVNRFNHALSDVRQRHVASDTATAISQMTLSLGGALAMAAIAWFAIEIASLSLPEIAAVTLVFARTMTAFASLQRNAQMFANMAPSYTYALKTLTQLQAEAEYPAPPPSQHGNTRNPKGHGQTTRMELNNVLSVRKVSFRYDTDAQTPALSKVTLNIPAGKITAIAGPSGAGKTTLADILLGLLEPSSGAILVDDIPINNANRRLWRRSCAYVPQDPYLFHDTIRANLTWARPNAPDHALWQALQQAAAADFVASLPQGIDTIVGDRGSRLSGGERQRIALARALTAQPTLLVLDEATSHLDPRNEQLIIETLLSLQGQLTIVAVAHREAMLAAAHHIIQLNSGQVTNPTAPPAPADKNAIPAPIAGRDKCD